MSILRIETMTYGAEDIAAGVKFYDDWGLEKVEGGAKGATFRTQANQHIHVRGATDSSLPAAPFSGSGLRECVWGVDNKANLDKLAGELAKDRQVQSTDDGVVHTYDETGFGVGLAVADITPVKTALTVNLNEDGPRLNNPVDRTPVRRVTPIRIGHVVYNIPKEGWEKASDFYLKKLGFKMSDRSLDLGDFMHCDGSRDHHNLFLAHAPNRAGFNHAAFELHDIDEIMVGGQYLKEAGWEPATRVGRHLVGSNIFWYFRNPAGGTAEYFSDMDLMDENWEPKVHEKHPGWAIWELQETEPAPTGGMTGR